MAFQAFPPLFRPFQQSLGVVGRAREQWCRGGTGVAWRGGAGRGVAGRGEVANRVSVDQSLSLLLGEVERGARSVHSWQQ